MSKLDLVRFHVTTGPSAVFERVRFVFREPRDLQLHGGHFRQRNEERRIPVEHLKRFDSTQWEIVTVEVRKDTGKFVKTGWRGRVNDEQWWLVVGYGNAVQTAYRSSKVGIGPGIVTAGAIYELAQRVNHELMNEAFNPTKAKP